eukprot:jgi/Chrpa1/8818/Chrysochromulina_OHIO_Genome00014491-RA
MSLADAALANDTDGCLYVLSHCGVKDHLAEQPQPRAWPELHIQKRLVEAAMWRDSQWCR